MERNDLSPTLDKFECRAQCLTLASHPVFQAPGPRMNRALYKNAFIHQFGEAVRQNIPSNTQAALEIIEAGCAL